MAWCVCAQTTDTLRVCLVCVYSIIHDRRLCYLLFVMRRQAMHCRSTFYWDGSLGYYSSLSENNWGELSHCKVHIEYSYTWFRIWPIASKERWTWCILIQKLCIKLRCSSRTPPCNKHTYPTQDTSIDWSIKSDSLLPHLHLHVLINLTLSVSCYQLKLKLRFRSHFKPPL